MKISLYKKYYSNDSNYLNYTKTKLPIHVTNINKIFDT